LFIGDSAGKLLNLQLSLKATFYFWYCSLGSIQCILKFGQNIDVLFQIYRVSQFVERPA